MADLHIGRVKVIKPAKNEMDAVCICPHCGRQVRYGDICTVNGIYNCHSCNRELHRTIECDKSYDYSVYERKATSGEYEPYKYVEDK